MSHRPSDYAAREQALDPGLSFLVQAPAGSGKTELLTDRILALLATVKRPEEIVAITFTNKAASEMHARVLEKLRKAQGAPELGSDRSGREAGEPGRPAESEHELRSGKLARAALARNDECGWKLLQHPARLAIRTIDAFCAGLVRGMPWLSGLGGVPAVATDARAHYLAAASATLELAGEHASVRSLLEHMDVDVAAAREAIASMLAQRDQWLPLLRHGIDRAASETALARTVNEELQRLAHAMPQGWRQALCEAARLACAALDGSSSEDHPLSALRDWQDDIPPSAEFLPQWRALRWLLLTGDGGVRKTVNVKQGFAPKSRQKEIIEPWLKAQESGGGHWAGLLAGVDDLPPAAFTDEQWQVLEAQLTTLALAVLQLQQCFVQAGKVDFIEIAQRAQEALGSADDPGELLLKLDASIRHLLIDEFQDTSHSQLRLLETLMAGWQEGDGRTLFLVGDPMQSIYRFRKAEVGLFIQAAERGVGGLPLHFLRLTDNFRSQAGVVQWVNRIFGALLPPENNAQDGAIRYTDASAFHAELPGPAVQCHTAADDAQAQDIALELVRQALDQRDANSAHPVAVLVRSRSHLSGLAGRLARAGIACRAVELVPLASREVVSDLVQLIRALQHPADRMAWLSVLRAPWCGLRLDALHALFGHDWQTPAPALLRAALYAENGAGPLAARLLPAKEYARLQRVADLLLRDANRDGALPFAAWLEQLWRQLGGAAVYDDPSAAQDAESLFALVERLAPYGGLDIEQLDAALEKLFAAPQAGAAQADTPPVEIMTMHKAKGLQFDTVILYGLHRQPRADDTPLVRFEQRGDRVLFSPVKPRAEPEHDPLARYLARRDKRRADYEVDRLLYVAATRARHRLHLVANVRVDADTGEVKAPVASSLLARLWPLLPQEDKQLSVDVRTQVDVVDAGSSSMPLRRLRDEAVAQLAGNVLMTQTVMAPMAQTLMTPTRDGAAQTPRGALAAGRSVWQTETPDAAATGTLAHAWLARIGDDGPAHWSRETLRAQLPLMQRQLTRAGVPLGSAAKAAQVVLETLEATLADERGQWLLSQAGARREWPLIDAEGRVSVIDLALSTEDGWLVVDYKTGQAQPGESDAAFAARMRQRHAEQLRRYCRHVSALDGRPAQGALYFPRARAWIALD